MDHTPQAPEPTTYGFEAGLQKLIALGCDLITQTDRHSYKLRLNFSRTDPTIHFQDKAFLGGNHEYAIREALEG